MFTPIELQNKQLKTGRGYSKKEADEFLEDVYRDYEKLYKQNLELKDKIGVLSEGVQYYKSIETTLQKALVLAEKTAKETCDAAKAKADSIEKEAEQKAQVIEQEAKQRAEELEREIREKKEGILREARDKAVHMEKEALLKAETLTKNAKDKKEKITEFTRKEWEETRKKCIAMVQQYNSFKAQFKKLVSTQLDMLGEDYFEIYTSNLKALLNNSVESLKQQESHVEAKDDVKDEDVEVKDEVRDEVKDEVKDEGLEEFEDIFEDDIKTSSPMREETEIEDGNELTAVESEMDMDEEKKEEEEEILNIQEEAVSEEIMGDTKEKVEEAYEKPEDDEEKVDGVVGREPEDVEGKAYEAGGEPEDVEGKAYEAGGEPEDAEGKAYEAGGEPEDTEGKAYEAGGEPENAEGKVDGVVGGEPEDAEEKVYEAGGESGDAEAKVREEGGESWDADESIEDGKKTEDSEEKEDDVDMSHEMAFNLHLELTETVSEDKEEMEEVEYDDFNSSFHVYNNEEDGQQAVEQETVQADPVMNDIAIAQNDTDFGMDDLTYDVKNNNMVQEVEPKNGGLEQPESAIIEKEEPSEGEEEDVLASLLKELRRGLSSKETTKEEEVAFEFLSSDE